MVHTVIYIFRSWVTELTRTSSYHSFHTLSLTLDMLVCFFVVSHYQTIAYSQFSSVFIADNHAASWTASSWRFCIVSWSAALASVDEKVTSATYLFWSLRIEIEGAGSLCYFMHHIFAIGQLISRSWYRSNRRSALFIRIKIAFALAWITMCIDFILSSSSYELTCFLVIDISHWWSWFECSAAITGAIGCQRLVFLERW